MAGCLIGLLLLVLVVVLVGGPLAIAALVAGVGALVVWLAIIYKNTRPAAVEKRLMVKYHDQAVVRGIMQNQYWIGQTEEQLRDSLGAPQARDVKQTQRSHSETWHYGKLSVTLDDHAVSGWKYRESRRQ